MNAMGMLLEELMIVIEDAQMEHRVVESGDIQDILNKYIIDKKEE